VTHFTLIYTIINAYRQYAICPVLAVYDNESSVNCRQIQKKEKKRETSESIWYIHENNNRVPFHAQYVKIFNVQNLLSTPDKYNKDLKHQKYKYKKTI